MNIQDFNQSIIPYYSPISAKGGNRRKSRRHRTRKHRTRKHNRSNIRSKNVRTRKRYHL